MHTQSERTPAHTMTYVLCVCGFCIVALSIMTNAPFQKSLVTTLTTPFTSNGQVNAEGGSNSLVGQPTISTTFINTVLAYYHSPAQGTGSDLYTLGKQYNIDPVFALAFFLHESTFGRAGMAYYTHSLGNLRCIPDVSCYQGYASFTSWANGYKAWYHLIGMFYMAQWHLYTVEQIIPTYAPAGDHNDVRAYIAAIEHAVATWRSGSVGVA